MPPPISNAVTVMGKATLLLIVAVVVVIWKRPGNGLLTVMELLVAVRFNAEVRARVAVSVSLGEAIGTTRLLKLANPDAKISEAVPLRAAGLPVTDTGLATAVATAPF